MLEQAFLEAPIDRAPAVTLTINTGPSPPFSIDLLIRTPEATSHLLSAEDPLLPSQRRYMEQGQDDVTAEPEERREKVRPAAD